MGEKGLFIKLKVNMVTATKKLILKYKYGFGLWFFDLMGSSDGGRVRLVGRAL